MSEQEFIGAKVLSSAFGEGEILHMDNGKATIAFPGGEKTLCLDIAFKSGSLRFADETMNLAFKQKEKEASRKDAEKEAANKEKRKQFEEKIAWVRKRIVELYAESKLRKKLFGDDYVYEEFERFKKEYREIIFHHVEDPYQYYEESLSHLIRRLGRGFRSFGLSDHF